MKKYKILIIDDEPMIIKGLQELVAWDEIGCEICGVAKNGEEGQQAIIEKTPDIVISDIQMPKLNGLEMIEALKNISAGIKFIILTGHREFDYASKAINLGVVKYLLKPTNIEDIKSAVAEAMMILDEERAKDEDIKALRSKLIQIEKQEISEDTNNGTEDLQVGNKDTEQKVNYLAVNAIKYMKENYSKKLDLHIVADSLFISSWYLCKVLKKGVDNSFVPLLNEIRISEAKNLLIESNYKVYEICEMVGYTDKSYFTKIFKKYTGMTPNQYRNSQY